MPCAVGIAIVILAAVLTAAIFFAAPSGDCKTYPPVFDYSVMGVWRYGLECGAWPRF